MTMRLRKEGLRGQLIPVQPVGNTMAVETREDLELELQDPEFVSYYGADQAKIQLAFTIVDARTKLNLTQKGVADTLKVSQPYIAKLERGDANPTIGKIGSLMARLGLRLAIQTEPLLPQPTPLRRVFLPNTWHLGVSGVGTAVGGGVMLELEEESSWIRLYKQTIPTDVAVAANYSRPEEDIQRPILQLAGGAV